MLFTVIKKNAYQDSINLMLLTNRINTLPEVKQSQIMMGTDANKDIYRNAGLMTADVEAAAPGANMALFSTPGEYTAPEIEAALDKGLHVFSFSDNISLEDEIRLKKKAHEKGLMFMEPDCGTGIISGIPIAFTKKSAMVLWTM